MRNFGGLQLVERDLKNNKGEGKQGYQAAALMEKRQGREKKKGCLVSRGLLERG